MADPVFSMRIPLELKQQLEEAAAAGDRSAGAEARRHIKAALAKQISDPGPLNGNDGENLGHSEITTTS